FLAKGDYLAAAESFQGLLAQLARYFGRKERSINVQAAVIGIKYRLAFAYLKGGDSLKAKAGIVDIFQNYAPLSQSTSQMVIDNHIENKFGNEIFVAALRQMLLSGEINNSKTERYMLDFILAVNPAGVDVFLVELRKRAKDKRKREIAGILEAWIDRLSPVRAYESAAVLFKDREYPLAERAAKSGLGKCLLSPAQKYKEKLEDLMALIFRLREKLDDAESLLRGQDFEGAASRFREAAYLNPEDADIGIKYNSTLRLAEAERLYQQGNDEEALSLCRESGASGNYLKAMTDKINSLLRGCELRLNRKPSEALCVLAQIVKAYPADERAKRLYNGVSETVKKINESMAGLRQAFKDNAYSQLVPTGRFILEQENNREALNILLGSALKAYKERFYDEALKLSGLILEFQPAHPQAARIRENS
ncbi:MAG: hypothetical protein AAB299_04630, partial [Thermodesulfobacteriota bacterium]